MYAWFVWLLPLPEECVDSCLPFDGSLVSCTATILSFDDGRLSEVINMLLISRKVLTLVSVAKRKVGILAAGYSNYIPLFMLIYVYICQHAILFKSHANIIIKVVDP